MADVKQILVVDDHFEMLEFLRSMLELSNRDHQVLGVPSAEEGFLELRRTPFDLVITDVRLPGMSGFELVRQIQALRPDLPIIMITAYSSPQGKREAAELGVYRYFEKPLDADALLASVHTALYGDDAAPAADELPLPDEPALDVTITDQARDRLQTLRSDTGAAQILLATSDGNVVFTVGEGRDIDALSVAQILARDLENSLLLARELSSPDPVMLHYQAGEQVDLYSANIGRAFFLVMLFDVESRRGRISTVWIFAQRAIKDLKGLLQVEDAEDVAAKSEPSRPPAEEPEQPPAAPEPAELPASEDVPPAAEVEEASSRHVVDAPLEREEEIAAGDDKDDEETEEEPSEETPLELTGEDADLAALFEGLDQPKDVDAFWDEALAEETESGATDGLSFEEAQRRGLIPPEFDNPDE